MAVAGQDREWEVGEVAVVRGVFRDEDGNLTDPSTVSVKAKAPDGTVTTYTYAGGQVTKNSTGDYEKHIPITAGGKWVLGMVVTGTVATADHVEITVAPDPFA